MVPDMGHSFKRTYRVGSYTALLALLNVLACSSVMYVLCVRMYGVCRGNPTSYTTGIRHVAVCSANARGKTEYQRTNHTPCTRR